MGKRELFALNRGKNSQQNQGIRFLQSTLLLGIIFALAGCEITSLNSPNAAAPATSTRTRFSPTALIGASGALCALSAQGTVRCWGESAAGVLGTGGLGLGAQSSDMGDNLAAINVGTGRTVTAVSMMGLSAIGNSHVCVVLDNNTLKCWGNNLRGQLGQGDTVGRFSASSLSAVDLGTGRTAKSASKGGGLHTCAILDNDTLKCWGQNTNGQLGYGDTNHRGDGAGEMGDSLATIDLGTGRTAKKVVNLFSNTCAQLDNNTVKCWGQGSLGLNGGTNVQLGDGAGEMGDALTAVNLGTGRTAKDIAGSRFHVCVILDNDQVKCWGINGSGQLGYGDTTTRGTVAGDMGDSLAYVNLGTGRTAKKITSGTDFNCAILDNDTVKCWGYNYYGQLGQGHTNNLGDGAGEMGDALTAIDLGTGRTATAIAAGGSHVCAILDNATVKCWGRNLSGDLGLGDVTGRGYSAGQMGDNLAAVNLGTGRTATALAAGESTSCALLDNSTLKCWGGNTTGQLASGSSSTIGDESGETYVTLDLGSKVTLLALGGSSPGVSFACAVLQGGTVKCWGTNSEGQLGYGDIADRLPSSSLANVDLGTGRTAKSVTVGRQFSCALLDNNTVKCWGYNLNGQLGKGNTNSLGDGAGEMGDNLTTIDLGTGRTALDVRAGGSHVCALLDNSTVKCWGLNTSGQLGQGHANHLGDGAGEMGDALSAISLGTGRTAKAISAHGFSSCALLDNDTLKCWGNGSAGDTGQGTAANLGDGAGEMGDALPAISLGTGRTVKSVGGTSQSLCAILDNNTTKCWGYNFYGQLGQGHTSARGSAAVHMGDNLDTINWGSGRYATSIFVAPNNAYVICALLDDGTAKCVGASAYGQIHQGSADYNDNKGDAAGETGDTLSAIDLGYE